jgi:hypothetical protein
VLVARASEEPTAPWSITPYHTKKLERRTGEAPGCQAAAAQADRGTARHRARPPPLPPCSADALGNIIQTPDSIAESPAWTADAKLHVAAEALAAELGDWSVEELLDNAGRLKALLPGNALAGLREATLIRLGMRLDDVARQLVALRGLLPGCDIAAAVGRWPAILDKEPEALRAALAEVTLRRQGRQECCPGTALPCTAVTLRTAPLCL